MCFSVKATDCQEIPDCIPLADNQTCITVSNSGYHSDFFNPASRCEESGGRLLWLDDVSITDFTHSQLPVLLSKTCKSCSFFWIGLLQSINNDKLYFWKRTKFETLKQCNEGISNLKCFDNVNQTECELLGCCYRNKNCFYPGNTTKDLLNEYVVVNSTITPFHHARNDSSFRYCVGLQRYWYEKWILRTVDCKSNAMPTNGFLCQHECDNHLTDITVKPPLYDADKCNHVNSQCQHISGRTSGRNSCFEVVQSNMSSSWFESAAECELRGGRLMWLDNPNFDMLMNYNAESLMRNNCPNCTFMWIGLMQSVYNDTLFFWKRTQNETQTQCHTRPSNVTCFLNATKEQCGILGCCFRENRCLYPNNVDLDRNNVFHSFSSIDYSRNRRCVGIFKHPALKDQWLFSVNECSKNILYEHGYFCEFQCNDNKLEARTSTPGKLTDLLTTISSFYSSVLPTVASKMTSYAPVVKTASGTAVSFSHVITSTISNTGIHITPSETHATHKASTSKVLPAPTATSSINPNMKTTPTPDSLLYKTNTTSSTSFITSDIETTKHHTSVISVRDSIKSHCTPNGWDVSIDMTILRKIYPGAKASEIYMGENSCIGTELGNIVRFEQGLRECLTSEIVTQDSIVYRNKLIYAERDPIHQFIIRNYLWTVGIECDVQRNDTASAHVHHESSYTTAPYISGNSRYGVNITFYSDSNYENKIPGNPLHIQVGARVYVKIFTPSSDWRIKMRVHTCYTLPNDASPNNMKLFIIRNGCEVDANTHIISQSTHETRFVFQDFEYASNHEGLDIHCDATFCATADYSQQCLQTCNPKLIG